MGAVGARLGLDGVPRALGTPDVREVGLEPEFPAREW